MLKGKRREMGLGRLGLKEARDKADDVRRQVRAAADPSSTRKTVRDTKAAIPTFEAISREVIAESASQIDQRQGPLPVGACCSVRAIAARSCKGPL